MSHFESQSSPWLSWRLGFVALVAVVSLLFLIEAGRRAVSEAMVRASRPAQALSVRPQFADALLMLAKAKLEQGDIPEAQRLATLAFSESPMNAKAAELLARAQGPGQTVRARSIYQHASRLSRRENLTQLWLMNDAVQRGDYALAFDHADVLLRRRAWPRANIFDIFNSLLDRDVARKQLALLLVSDPPWRSEYLSAAGRRAAPAAAVQLISDLAASPSPAEMKDLAPLVQRLISNQNFSEALKVWKTAHRGSMDAALVHDADFSGGPGETPFDWQAPRARGAEVEWLSDQDQAGGIVLRHDLYSSVAPILRQMTLLKPGAYRLGIRSTVATPAAEGAFRVEVRCIGANILLRYLIRSGADAASHRAIIFTVPDSGCEAQWLTILPVPREYREDVELRVQQIDIAVLRQGVPALPLTDELL